MNSLKNMGEICYISILRHAYEYALKNNDWNFLVALKMTKISKISHVNNHFFASLENLHIEKT